MRLGINLASQPFRRDRPIIVASVLVGFLMVGTLALLVFLALIERRQLKDTRRQIANLERQLSALGVEQSRLETLLRKPENAEVLERSLFINSLLYRKGISWTKIFADLEKTLPHNVRVISIRPQVNVQNQVSLDMTVGAEQPEPLVQLLVRLETTDTFGGTSLHNRIAPSQTDPLYRYRVSVNYAQKF